MTIITIYIEERNFDDAEAVKKATLEAALEALRSSRGYVIGIKTEEIPAE